MKYRIITNGKRYRIQIRFFFFWTTHSNCFANAPFEFSDIAEAKEIVRGWEEQDRVKKLKWTTATEETK